MPRAHDGPACRPRRGARRSERGSAMGSRGGGAVVRCRTRTAALGAADAQPLLVKGGLRYGFAKIEPVRQPQPLDTAALARGRILARISSESAYAALGLGPGMNWWWIDHKGGTWRSVVYSEARNERSIKILDSLRPHPGYPWRQSIARFVFLDTVVAMWHYSGGHCVPTSNLPAWYALLEKAAPWRTPGPPRRP